MGSEVTHASTPRAMPREGGPVRNEVLDFAESLLQLDPIRGYAERAAAAVAKVTGAEHHYLEISGSEAPAPEMEESYESVAIPLRAGREAVGTLVLGFTPGTVREDTLRLARWAARMLGRGMHYAQRLSEGGVRRGDEEIAEALARSPLTPRERDVVNRLVAGMSTRDIASQTKLTVATVNTYLKRIFSKLGVHSRVELIAKVAGTARELERDERTSMIVSAIRGDEDGSDDAAHVG